MLKFLPEGYPLKVCLVDCDHNNLFVLGEYLDQGVHTIPTILCAASTRNYVSPPVEDNKKPVDDGIMMFAKHHCKGICIFCLISLCI